MLLGTEVGVDVGGIAVGVFVGAGTVGVRVGDDVAVAASVGVPVALETAVAVGVFVRTFVGVWVGVKGGVAVHVGVRVGVHGSVGVHGGVLVEGVSGPAARAGLEPGDVVLSLNGTPVVSVEQLRGLLDKAGKQVAVLVQRGQARIFVPVALG